MEPIDWRGSKSIANPASNDGTGNSQGKIRGRAIR